MKKLLKGFDQTIAWIIGGALALAIFTTFYFMTKSNVKQQIEAEEIALARAQREMSKSRESTHSKESENTHDDHEQPQARDTKEAGGDFSRWGYQGSTGPAYWGDLSPDFKVCGQGKTQSPLDLTGTKLDDRLKPLKLNYRPSEVTLTLAHQTVTINFDPGQYLDLDGEKFDLKHMYFRTPSEHQINGLPYEMEIQFEHRNVQDEPFWVSVLVTSSKKSHGGVAHVLTALPQFDGEKKVLPVFNPNQFLPAKRLYYAYTGSQTFPPCEENAPWRVFTTTIEATAKQIDQFVSLQHHNSRGHQRQGKRIISRSNR